jgi:cytochrome P450
MLDFFSDAARRDPYPLYAHARRVSPVVHVPPPFNGWLIFDYAGVRQALTDHATFSSRVPAPPWFIFSDPPLHAKLRGLISRAFTPRMIAGLEPRIRRLSRELLDQALAPGRDRIDLAADYAVPLPMIVISEMIGIPRSDWPRFKRWSDGILTLSYTRSGGVEAERAMNDFVAVTSEMTTYLAGRIAHCRAHPADDLLTRLVAAEIDGQRLSQQEILSFFQLLIVGGQETTTNLINNAILSFLDHPDHLALLRQRPDLLGSAIEEVLRFRSPLQWMMRTPTRDVEIHGVTIPAGKLVLPMIGSANRDPAQFPDPDRFDITRSPNPHVAFGIGIHFCMGAPLARMETSIALTDLLSRLSHFEYAGDGPWTPRRALHVHGPSSLPLHVTRDQAYAALGGP